MLSGEIGCLALEKPLLGIQSDINQSQQRRHFNQRPNGGRQRFRTIDAEASHSHSNGELEVIAAGREGLRDHFLIRHLDAPAHKQTGEEDDGEVEQERHRHSANLPNVGDNRVRLARKHDKDGEQQTQECQRTNQWHKPFLKPSLSSNEKNSVTGNHTSYKRNT